MPSAPRAPIGPCSGRTLKICPAVPGSTAVICSTLPRITAAPVLSPVAAATCGSAFSFWASARSTPPVVPAPELITKSPANDRSMLALTDAVVEEAKMVMNPTRPTPIISAEVGGSRHLVPPYGGSDGVRNLRTAGKGELSRKGRTEPSTPSRFQSTSGDPSSPGIVKPPVVSRAPLFVKLPDARIIRCPESAAIQAGNPDHRAEARNPAFLPAARVPGFGFRVGVVNARTALSSSSRSAFPLRGWSRGGGGCGRMPVGGSLSLRRQATCGDGGPAGIAARMPAASPAGMPAVLTLPRGITVAAVSPAGARPGDGPPGAG